MEAAKVQAQKYIDENAVVVFSKSYCPFCRASKALLSSMGAKFQVFELNQIPDGEAMQDALEELSGQRTVPNIYIKQQHVGGNSDLQGIKGETLESLLRDAGAL